LSWRGISGIGRWGAALVIACVSLAALWLPAGASAAGEGAISGKVTRATGGAPVNKALVCAERENSIFVFECASTAADGSYEITGLPAGGGYVVSFEAGESGLYLVRQYYKGVSRWEEAEPVTVSSGSTTTGIDAALAEGGAIAGKVTAAATGMPIAEVEVCSWLESDGEFDGCTYTANDGTYEIVGVHPGLHELEFWDFEAGYEPQFLNSISVAAGERKSGVNVAMSLAGRISGHVYFASTHQPAKGTLVCAIGVNSGKSRGCGPTDKTGAYEFLASPGRWKIVFSPEPSESIFFDQEEGELEGAGPDGWPTQFWNLKSSLAQADVIELTQGGVRSGVDGQLGYVPPPGSASSQPSPTLTVPSAVIPPAPSGAVPPSPPRPTLLCKPGFVKKHLRGKQHCVRKRKHRRHHSPHH
jgi:hypothetical protein